ncbi:hypothetical protein HELRODRAFT_161381 [Helobdella robusta]|uniref:Uncharacterized protein n=1 Tax=Helobdella robusta TaxID=6412 RepID=T1ERF0_HELRO|nr:hypothetical protein HELRODRAFT_161381 [Helobdella robusta]ESO02144.1 hypothetical protein HELRODRAFT_161381 [Helobdella robusta]
MCNVIFRLLYGLLVTNSNFFSQELSPVNKNVKPNEKAEKVWVDVTVVSLESKKPNTFYRLYNNRIMFKEPGLYKCTCTAPNPPNMNNNGSDDGGNFSWNGKINVVAKVIGGTMDQSMFTGFVVSGSFLASLTIVFVIVLIAYRSISKKRSKKKLIRYLNERLAHERASNAGSEPCDKPDSTSKTFTGVLSNFPATKSAKSSWQNTSTLSKSSASTRFLPPPQATMPLSTSQATGTAASNASSILHDSVYQKPSSVQQAFIVNSIQCRRLTIIGK